MANFFNSKACFEGFLVLFIFEKKWILKERYFLKIKMDVNSFLQK